MKTVKKMRPNKRSNCPVANTLDVVGDKWTLLIVRDLLFGKKRYKDFEQSDEGIPTNILANRLKSMESSGLIEKSLYNEHPPRYEYHLTVEGKKLGGIVRYLKDWGRKNLDLS